MPRLSLPVLSAASGRHAMAHHLQPHHAHAHAHRRVRAVVFDMDGTLTMQGAIDFKRMRARVGAPPGVDVLAHVAAAPDAAHRARLEAVLREEEEAGMARLRLTPDCGRLFAYLAGRGVHRALLTRNNDSAMLRTVQLIRAEIAAAAEGGDGGAAAAPPSQPPAPLPAHPPYANELFSHMLSRAFTPTKPHPAPLLHLCAAWGVHPSQCVMVGDSLDDIACARAAGTVGVLIGADAGCAIYREALPHADFTIASLSELRGVIEALDAAAAAVAGAAVAGGDGQHVPRPLADAATPHDADGGAGDTVDLTGTGAR